MGKMRRRREPEPEAAIELEELATGDLLDPRAILDAPP
jgi:hypothetical protein